MHIHRILDHGREDAHAAALVKSPMPRRELERRAGLGRTASFECLKALREHGWVRMTTTHDKTIVAANPNTPLPPRGPGTTTATCQSAPRPTHP